MADRSAQRERSTTAGADRRAPAVLDEEGEAPVPEGPGGDRPLELGQSRPRGRSVDEPRLGQCADGSVAAHGGGGR